MSGGQEKMDVPAQAESKFSFPLPFVSVQAHNGLDGHHSHRRGSSASLMSLIEMLVSSINTRTVTRKDSG